MNKINYTKIFIFLISTFFNCFLFYLLLIACFSIYFRDHKKVLNYLYFNYYEVKSGSMVPKLKVNDIVIIKKISEKECHYLRSDEKDGKENGDIVVFESENISIQYPIIHRVIKNDINKKNIRTKGDANAHDDNYDIEYKKVVGKHIFTIRYFKIILICLFFIFFIPQIKFFYKKILNIFKTI